MSAYIDADFLNQCQSHLRNFKKRGSFLWNFSCPFCGDSKKDTKKARGYIFKKGDDLFFKCHNCNIGRNFNNFLNFVDPDLHERYLVERFKIGKTRNIKSNEFKEAMGFKKVEFNQMPELLTKMKSVSRLPDDHPAKVYVKSRMIPDKHFGRLYYCEDFKQACIELTCDPEHYGKLPNGEPRLVIPFIDTDGTLNGFQGRSLEKEAKIRYITAYRDKEHRIPFGWDKVNRMKRVYVLEGALDSLFLDNSIAANCSDLSSMNKLGLGDDVVYVFDREPRNKEICKEIDKCLKLGYSVALLPENLTGKDLNEYVLKDNIQPDEIRKLVDSHVVQGMVGNLEFVNWRKC